MSAVVRRVLPIIDASVPPSVDNYYHALPTPRRRHAHRGSAVLRILFVYAIFSDAYWQRLSDAFSHVRGANSRVAVVLTQACSGKGRVGGLTPNAGGRQALLGAVAAFRYLLVFTVAKHTIAPRNSTGAVAIKSNSLSNGDIADDLECLQTLNLVHHPVDNNKKLSPRGRAIS